MTHFLPKDAAKVAKALVAMGIPDFRKQREDVHLHPEAVKKLQAQLPGVVHGAGELGENYNVMEN